MTFYLVSPARSRRGVSVSFGAFAALACGLLAPGLALSAGKSAQPAQPAQPAPSKAPLQLKQILTHLERTSPELAAIDAQIAAMSAQREVVTKYPEPTVSLAVQPLPVQTRVGPQRLRVGVTQGVPWLAKFDRRVELVDAQVAAAQSRKKAVLARLQRDVRVPWSQLAWLQATADIVAQQSALLVGLEPSVLARLRIGQANYEDAQRLRLAIGELDQRRESLLDKRRAVSAMLIATAGLQPSTALAEPSFAQIAGASSDVPSVASLAGALAANPELVAATSLIEAARAKVAAVDVQRMPDFAFGIDWIVVGEAVMPNVADSGSDTLMLMAAVKLPVWRHAYDAQTTAAQANVSVAKAKRDVLLRKAEAKLAQLLFELRDAQRQHDLYSKDLVPRAKSALTTALTSYANGKAHFNSLIELQKQLMTFSIRLATADANRDVAQANLDLLLGRPQSSTPTHVESKP